MTHDGSNPQVSVIVPARNAEVALSVLLIALSRQTVSREVFEVIVVDDASQDDTADVAARHGAKVIQSGERAGSYGARNAALPHARGSLIAFTDADCIPAPYWIERGTEAVAASGSGVVAGRVQFDLGLRPRFAALLDCVRFLDQEAHVADGYGATANLWLRRTVIEQIGGFNSQLMSGGDADWGLRAAAAGVVTEFDSELVVLHECRDRFREVTKKAYRLGSGLAQLRMLGGEPVRSHFRSRWNDPRFYRPGRTLLGFRRVAEHGFSLSKRQRAALVAAEYVFVRLPMALGELREARALQRR